MSASLPKIEAIPFRTSGWSSTHNTLMGTAGLFGFEDATAFMWQIQPDE
jgi:hypothetical protein